LFWCRSPSATSDLAVIARTPLDRSGWIGRQTAEAVRYDDDGHAHPARIAFTDRLFCACGHIARIPSFSRDATSSVLMVPSNRPATGEEQISHLDAAE